MIKYVKYWGTKVYETLRKEKQFTLVKGQNYIIGSEQIYQR